MDNITNVQLLSVKNISKPCIRISCNSFCHLSAAGCGPVKADIVLLIDESGSVGRRNFPKQLDFCNTLVDSLTIGADDVRVGAVTFSNAPVFHFALDSYTTSTDLKTAISNIGYARGGTDIAAGINYVKDTFLTSANGDRADVADYILLITDGNLTRCGRCRAKCNGRGNHDMGGGDWLGGGTLPAGFDRHSHSQH